MGKHTKVNIIQNSEKNSILITEKIIFFFSVFTSIKMENVFRVKLTEKQNIGQTFAKYKDELSLDGVDELPKTYDQVREILGIQDEVNEDLLEESISINNLAQSNDLPVVDFQLHDMYSRPANRNIEIPNKALSLHSVRQNFETPTGSTCRSNPKKYNRYRYLANTYDNSVGPNDLKPLEDILVTIRVYEPFMYVRGSCSRRKPRLSQEYVLLGRQRLTELRDKIFCHCQFGPFLDISDDYESISNVNPADESEASTSETDDIGFFFITDTFYNDTRTSDAEYSTEIQKWMKRQSDIQPSQVKLMQDTKFEDLDIRLGFPQLFRHYLNCEHVVCFSDMRLLAPDDSLKSTDYPMLRCVSSSKQKLCVICGTVEATFVVRNSNSHIQDPTFLCRTCLISFHYVDGKKIGQFQVFRYYGNRPIWN